jgi:broad specificity phosphatase PhoE
MRLGLDLRNLGRFDKVYHDGFQRSLVTARNLGCSDVKKHFGPRPWHMGPTFEGKEITEQSIERVRSYIDSGLPPPKGETFYEWYSEWMTFLDVQGHPPVDKKIGIVTHNRNIQAVYATHRGRFHYPVYDCIGPDFLTIHVYQQGHIAPWNGKTLTNGIYLIRHGETEFGQ